MSIVQEVRIRNIEGSGSLQSLRLREATLHHELLHGDRIAPEAELLVNGRWVSLVDHPAPTWLDLLATAAVTAVERFDAAEAERVLARFQRYGGDRPGAERHEATCIGLLVRGHLALCGGRARAAASDFERAASRRSRFAAAAAGNLGVALALARDPEAALRALERALALDDGFLPARVSLRNLARTLAEEGAPGLPGRPPWGQIAGQHDGILRRTNAAEVQALLNPARLAPGPRLWHVFPHDRYSPGIGSRVVVPPYGAHAAALLVEEAGRSLRDERYAEAQLLASAASCFNAAAKPEAAAVFAAALSRNEEQRLLEEARLLTSWLIEFFAALDSLTLDNLDAAREPLARLAAFLDEAALTRLYDERVEGLVVAALGSTPPASEHRRRLLLIAHQFAASARGPAFARAAARCQSEPALTRFWSALERGRLDDATEELGQASANLDPAADPLDRQQRLLEQLGDQAPVL